MMLRLKGLVLVACLATAPLPVVASDGQDPVPTLRTDDLVYYPPSDTNTASAAANKEAAAAKAAEGKAEASGKAEPGYVRVATASGYSFERPATWTSVPDLIAKDAPGYFRYDAIFQDPKTGSVISAISVDRAQLLTPIDVADPKTVNTLLATMLNPTGAKEGVKIFRQTTGATKSGAKWLRVKAQGTGKSVDGSSVDTTFWVQLIQTDAVLALVAVAYPSQQQDLAAQAAFHTVRTLEVAAK
ncbi:MAG: hypothetical protein IPF53_04695 [Blastocatellia bacterium]|nr:hypothetical protein [Blastocatellia bacterium]